MLSEVRRESGGEIRPETCELVGQPPLEYGGGPFPYIDVGLTMAAMVEGPVYDNRSGSVCSSFSRLRER